MLYNSSRALQLLRLGSGLQDATFRHRQEEAIRHIVEGRGRLLVDSRWTMTVAAWLLRTNGAGEVRPLALALTGNA